MQSIELVTANLVNIVETANSIKSDIDTLTKTVDSEIKKSTSSRELEIEKIKLPSFNREDLY